jgi:isoleucyl-tRNA synthetase
VQSGNTALAVNKEVLYQMYCIPEKESELNTAGSLPVFEYIVLAKNRAVEILSKNGLDISAELVDEFKGEKLLGKKYLPPFNTFNNEDYLSKLENSDNIFKIWHADFITDESGTGIAHEAPAYGAEDMDLAKANNIPVIKHVMINGHFINDVERYAPELAGLVVKKKDDSISTDIEIVKWLAHNGKLFSKEKIVHSYPLCWRCKTPLLNYATSSWFVDVPSIKDKIISENSKVNWVPDHIKDGRFGKWLEGAREWAVSRRRYWGAPLPIWKNRDGSEVKVLGSLEDLAKDERLRQRLRQR